MYKSKDFDFERLLDDERFTGIVLSDTPESEKYIENLILENPDHKELILNAVQFLRTSRNEIHILSDADVEEAWKNITLKTTASVQQKTVKSPKIKISLIWRIAACIALVLALTVSFYHVFRKNSPSVSLDNQIITGDNALIILSDGSKHFLEKDNSRIEYQADGKEILIDDPDHQSKKITNKESHGEEILNQIIVPFGRRHSIDLSDGTRVQLNSGSKLIFPAKFSRKIREVYLAGEGYFEVAKKNDVPFIVKTDYLDIKVTGTRFNISAYKDEKVATAVLVEGSIKVSENTKVISNHQYNLTPGQACFFSVCNSISEVKNVDVVDHISWINGWFQFQDQPLNLVIKKVEKYYNKSVSIEGEMLPKTLISGKLYLSDKFENVMLYLIKALETDYELTDKGTYLIKDI